jgi:hypothetical protein
MKDEGDLRVVVEDVEERRIALLISLLEHAIEIANGLMVVEGEDQADTGHSSLVGGW